ncbi:carbohydrate-binding module family 20 protein [Baudoinia panamericana UAMH 10762]|uniref:laccase n=1 Tax=Baudoinia panamericana (strain UAMH 10762) TaxID=717646 RepID=M2LHN1_BAUPA|nr:carbohydrate-binding module family 20 protein [Baudoinia panamericana UAMH 10762]EMC93672.1 carbohydrate-binding module family 20 protein [Baudoinia panamericana UAMH 10762]
MHLFLGFLVSCLLSVGSATVLHRHGHQGRHIHARQDCATVAVVFDKLVTTQWGESVSIAGSIPELGNWDPNSGVPLNADQYTDDNPLWSTTVDLPAGTNFEYKYVVFGADGSVTWDADPNESYAVPVAFGADGSVTWEADPNHSYTVPSACASIQSDTWQCVNEPSARGCWSEGYNINTDFDVNWPNTGVTVYYDLTIAYTTLAPDGFARTVTAINGQYPGPTIEANWGDTISVTVANQLPDNGTSIHWHGLRQFQSNSQDGVPGVTECPIAPGQSRTYTFQATQYGTSWYHSHLSCQYGDGVLGPIIIHGPATANYDIELGPLLVADWYYGGVSMLAAQSQHENALPPEADNALINGMMVSSSGGSYHMTPLTAGQRHLVRLINTAVDNHFVVSLDGHTLEVIATDFVPVVPYTTDTLFIGIGQRYDVIITADQAPGAYWFRADVQDTVQCGSNFNNGNIRSIFAYQGHESETPISSPYSYEQRCTDETGLTPYWNSYVPVGQIGTFTELTTAQYQVPQSDGSLNVYWKVNGSAFNVDWAQPTLQYVQTGNTNYPSDLNLIQLPQEGAWVYWVIQEVAGDPYFVAIPHPIHLHGHDFYILGTGTDTWTAADADNLNYDNPTRRDVAMLPSGGWLALAFQLDNPGAWLMHCHIAWHAGEGLALQFLESPGSISSIPADFDDQCNAWSSYYDSDPSYMQQDSGI